MIKAGAAKDGLDVSEQHLLDCGYGKDGANGCSGAQPGAYAKFYNKGKKKILPNTMELMNSRGPFCLPR